MQSSKDKASYCIGFETGKNLRQQFAELEQSILIEGFTDAISGSNPKLSQEEMGKVIDMIRQQVERQQRDFVAKIATENKRIGEDFLEKNKKEPGIKTLSSGLQYKVLKEGKGRTPTLLDVVKTHYKGTFISGEVFDSSYDRNEPQVFPVNRVIPGWAEALQNMKEGDKWQIFVPSYLAYGEQGFGPVIPPNATLVFEMELISIEE